MGNVTGREVVGCGRNGRSRERDAKSRGSGSNRPAWVIELGKPMLTGSTVYKGFC